MGVFQALSGSYLQLSILSLLLQLDSRHKVASLRAL